MTGEVLHTLAAGTFLAMLLAGMLGFCAAAISTIGQAP